MEPTDGAPGEEGPAAGGSPSRPWGPGLPAPGAPVAGYGVGRDDGEVLAGSTATELYEAARFPDLEEVRAAGASSSAARRARPHGDGDAEGGALHILGVPAPKEIAGPVLAALALAAALFGWRWRRRRRR